MSNTIPPSELLAFQEAMRGKKGDFDSWLECNNEAEVISYINAHAAAVTAAKDARIKVLEDALRLALAELDELPAWSNAGYVCNIARAALEKAP